MPQHHSHLRTFHIISAVFHRRWPYSYPPSTFFPLLQPSPCRARFEHDPFQLSLRFSLRPYDPIYRWNRRGRLPMWWCGRWRPGSQGLLLILGTKLVGVDRRLQYRKRSFSWCSGIECSNSTWRATANEICNSKYERPNSQSFSLPYSLSITAQLENLLTLRASS